MKRIYVLLLAFSAIITACQKATDWLDVKPRRSDVTPTTLADYQALLDFDQTLNAFPNLPQVSADDFFVPYSTFQSAIPMLRNAHTWEKDVFAGGAASDWNTQYTRIEYANVCLEGLDEITRDASNAAAWDNIRGSALFVRASAYYALTQEFAAPYRPSTAASELGVPIRKSSDVNEISTRPSLSLNYERIIEDLKEATSLLPFTPVPKTRPSAIAAEALLARVFLIMQDYEQAGMYADRVLSKSSDLLDYNTLNTTASYAFPNITVGNKEVLYYATSTSTQFTNINAYVDTNLYSSYEPNDLRKSLLFRTSGNYSVYRGSYTGSIEVFSGLAINEMYLIRAESAARQGSTSAAMADLNTLLAKRWKTGTYVPLNASTPVEALPKILAERRKELLLVGSLRWEDLRRLNQDPAFAKTLVRILNGQTYTLLPNSLLYTLPIPDNEIRFSGIEQNPR